MGARILVVDDSPTIRKVVSEILSARAFEPIAAADGQEALALLGREPIDLILLDFVMPNMNGYEFCRTLRADPDHRALPVVLMSAKGDKIRSKFVQQTGAMDAITKPFDARGLIAVVEGALKRYEEGRIRPLPDPSKLPDEYMSGDSYRPSPSQRSDPALSRVWAAREIGLHIARLVTPELAKIPSLSRSELDSLPQVFTRMLTPEVLSSLNLVLRAALPPEKDREVLSGDISVISIAEVLQLLNLQRQTGALAIYSRHNREVTLYVRDGNIDLASWRGLRDEFFVGRYLIEQGVVTREMLAGALEQALDRKQLLGEALVELGVIRAEHVRQALIRQTSELVYEVVRWTNGRFRFASGTRLPAAERAELGLPVGGLVMEGFRRVDEWRLIEGSFHFDEVLQRDEPTIERISREAKLTSLERQVLDAIDGTRTVREVVDHMTGSSFEVCKILYQLLNSRLVRRAAA